MKLLLLLTTIALAAIIFPVAPAAAAVLLFVVGTLLHRPTHAEQKRLCVTLSVAEIVQDTLDVFTMQLPMLESMGTDLSSATARKDDTIHAHIAGLPSVQDYDATAGYEANAAAVEDLLTDVDVAMDRLKHVPVKVAYLKEISSKKNLYREAIRNIAYVLSKSVIDYALTKCVVANFTGSTLEANGNVGLDTTEKVRTALNTQAAAVTGRYGICSSAFAQSLQLDSRVGSAFFYGQLNGDYGYRIFQNLSGFGRIYEYPSMPTNSENLSAFFADRRAITLATRLPAVQDDIASQLNIPQIASFNIATNPESGLSLLTIMWQKQGTFDVWMTMALLYGVTAGAQGGTALGKTDNAGHRVKTA